MPKWFEQIEGVFSSHRLDDLALLAFIYNPIVFITNLVATQASDMSFIACISLDMSAKTIIEARLCKGTQHEKTECACKHHDCIFKYICSNSTCGDKVSNSSIG